MDRIQVSEKTINNNIIFCNEDKTSLINQPVELYCEELDTIRVVKVNEAGLIKLSEVPKRYLVALGYHSRAEIQNEFNVVLHTPISLLKVTDLSTETVTETKVVEEEPTTKEPDSDTETSSEISYL